MTEADTTEIWSLALYLAITIVVLVSFPAPNWAVIYLTVFVIVGSAGLRSLILKAKYGRLM